MTRDEIRLELIKIAHTHGRSSAEAVERAKIYETYVVGEVIQEIHPEKVKPSRKAARQPDILD